MTTQVRVSGVIIESDDVVVQPAQAAGQPRRRGTVDEGVGTRREDAVLISALQAAGVELADAIPVSVKKPSIEAPSVRRAGPREPLRAIAKVKVPLQADEQAVVLLEEGGEYRWITASAVADLPVATMRSRGGRAPTGDGVRHAEFNLELDAAAAGTPQPGARSRGWIGDKLVKGAIAYVLRFVVNAGSGLLIRRLEKSVVEGLVQIGAVDPAAWKPVRAEDVRPATSGGRAPRLLLLVHGTFSSTAGGFGALAATPEGRSFLSNALSRYDAVLGYDHHTLSLEPEANAAAILAALRAIGWQTPPHIDIVAHSRGGLVTRELVERQLPASGWSAAIGAVVFVGCTNGGTQLANADQWKTFADHYTNIALGALRLGGLALAAAPWTVVARGAIQGVGILVKAIAVGALKQGGIPGLAAMQPDGAVVRRLNSPNAGQLQARDAQWYAVTSNFEPKFALDLTPPSELPRRLLSTLLARFADAATDSLYGEDNDLVVHVRAMTEVDAGSEDYFKDRLDFTANGKVYHTNYFAQDRTAQKLAAWLQLEGAGKDARAPGRGRSGPASQRGPAPESPAARTAQSAAAAAAAQIDALLAQRGETAQPEFGRAPRLGAKAKRKTQATSAATTKAKRKSGSRTLSGPASKGKRKAKAAVGAKASPKRNARGKAASKRKQRTRSRVSSTARSR